MEEKIKITAEIGKNEVAAFCFLAGVELTDERWEQLSQSPVSLNFNLWDKDEQKQLKLLLVSAAMISANIK